MRNPFKEELLVASAFLFEQANGNTLSDYELEELARHGLGLADADSLASEIRQSIADERTTESFRSSAYWALGKRFDPQLIPFFRHSLAHELQRSPNAAYQIMIALDNLGEPMFSKARNGYYSILDSDLNHADARAYLNRSEDLGA